MFYADDTLKSWYWWMSDQYWIPHQIKLAVLFKLNHRTKCKGMHVEPWSGVADLKTIQIITGGHVYWESHTHVHVQRSYRFCKRKEYFSSSEVGVCFSSDATLYVNKELIIITLVNGIRVVIKRINTLCNNCVWYEVL